MLALINFMVCQMTTTDQWPGCVCTYQLHGVSNDHHWPMTRLCLHLSTSWCVKWPPLTNDQAVFAFINFMVCQMTTTDQWPGCVCIYQLHGVSNDHHWPMTRLWLHLPTLWFVQWPPLTNDQAVFTLTKFMVRTVTNTDQWPGCVYTYQIYGPYSDHHWPMTRLCLRSPTSWSVQWPLTNDQTVFALTNFSVFAMTPLTNDQPVFALTNFMVRAVTTTDQWPGCVCTYQLYVDWPYNDQAVFALISFMSTDHTMTRLCLHLSALCRLTIQWPGCVCTYQLYVDWPYNDQAVFACRQGSQGPPCVGACVFCRRHLQRLGHGVSQGHGDHAQGRSLNKCMHEITTYWWGWG